MTAVLQLIRRRELFELIPPAEIARAIGLYLTAPGLLAVAALDALIKEDRPYA